MVTFNEIASTTFSAQDWVLKKARVKWSPSLNAVAFDMAYFEHVTCPRNEQKGTILFIHGFPETSFQYRLVMWPFARAKYRCIALDYTGAGLSRKQFDTELDYRKTTLAEDVFRFVDYLGIVPPIHVVGHDIGGMIAFTMANRQPYRVNSVTWGECCLPGTQTYNRDRTDPVRTVEQFHFIFHCVPDLGERLVAGNEKLYLTHFFKKNAHNYAAFTPEVIDYYTRAYSQPGAMRNAFNLYKMFEDDAFQNKDWIQKHGKCDVPTLIISGDRGRHKDEAEEMVREVTNDERVEVALVPDAGHYVAEENPAGFVSKVLPFIEKHTPSPASSSKAKN